MMQTPASGVRCADPWLVRQICDELEGIQAAGDDVPREAFRLAEDLGHLIDEGVSPRIVAEHAIELAKRLRL